MGFTPAIAQAELTLGYMSMGVAPVQAEQHVLAALRAGLEAGDDRTAAEAATMQLTLLLVRGQKDEGRRWLPMAFGTIARLTHREDLEAEALTAEAFLLPSAPDTPARMNSLLERALATRLRAHGPNHPSVVKARLNLATAYLSGDATSPRFDEGVKLLNRTFEEAVQVYGEAHPVLGVIAGNLSTLARLRGDGAEALAWAERAYAGDVEVFGAKNPALMARLSAIAYALLSLGRPAEALARMNEALELFDADPSARPGERARLLTVLADALSATGKTGPAESRYRAAIQAARSTKQHDAAVDAMAALAGLHLRLHRPARARSLCSEAVRVAARAGERRITNAIALRCLGLAELDRGRPRQAVGPLRRAKEILTALGPAGRAVGPVDEPLARAERSSRSRHTTRPPRQH
jgi:tetratricopeptide (TPR) repeat protein